MYRHSSARALSAQPFVRHGFTLVELLVVITIIAMLVGLLVPAVMMARSAARRAQCINNQRNLGTALANYMTAKMKYPPLFDVQPMSTTTPVQRVGWVPPLLPYIEQNPLYQVFQNNQWNSAQTAYVETLICPARNPTGTVAPLSYVVNAGVTDRFKNTGTNPPRMDNQENGLFFDHYASKTNPTSRNLRPPVTDVVYVSSHDGTPTTLVFSENLDAMDWIEVGTGYTYSPPQPADAGFLTNYTDGAAVHSWFQSMIWHIPQPTTDDNYGITSPTGILLNKRVGTGQLTSYRDDFNGRPSSNHSGGFIVTMADGSSRMLSEEIEYRVYCLLMSPDSQNASDPKYPPSPPFAYPKNWYQMNNPTLPLKAVTDNEIY